MATKKCPKCAEPIQDSAKKCKHCQADLRNWFVRHKILTVILAILFLGMCSTAINESETQNGRGSSNDSSSTTEVEAEETIQITARALYSAYSENEIAADELYKNKWLEVSGTVSSIGKDIVDSMFVTLETGNFISSVQCMLEDSELDKATALTEGQNITVYCKNSGLLMNVLLRDCIIR